MRDKRFPYSKPKCASTVYILVAVVLNSWKFYEKEARRLAEDALVALEKRKKWSRAGQITDDEIMHHAYVLKLRHDLSDVQRKMRTLTEEAQVTRLPPSVS